MSIKLKALGLGLLAAMAMGAFAVVNASATTPAGSHFLSHATEHHVIIKGTEQFNPANPSSTPHNLTFQRTVGGEASGDPIKCTHVAYHGTLSGAPATTSQSILVRPDYTGDKNCSTKGTGPHDVKVDVPESCGTNVFQFTSGNPGTIHVLCTITVTHPSCEITVIPQTVTGATYTAASEGGKSSLTVDINAQNIQGQFHSGICVFLGTNQTFHMKGSVAVWGEDTLQNRVGITHT